MRNTCAYVQYVCSIISFFQFIFPRRHFVSRHSSPDARRLTCIVLVLLSGYFIIIIYVQRRNAVVSSSGQLHDIVYMILSIQTRVLRVYVIIVRSVVLFQGRRLQILKTIRAGATVPLIDLMYVLTRNIRTSMYYYVRIMHGACSLILRDG